MKKLIAAVSILLACFLLCCLSGCDNPNSLQLDLTQGCGQQIKLIHLNASTAEKRERINAFLEVMQNAEPLKKDFSMFAYYPDYKLELAGTEDSSGVITAIIDINGEYVDFYYPGPYPEASETIYRSPVSAKDFKNLVHQSNG